MNTIKYCKLVDDKGVEVGAVAKVTVDDKGDVVGFPVTYTLETLNRLENSNETQATEIATLKALLPE